MKISIPEVFKQDYVTREAGERLRLMIYGYVTKEKSIELDFADKMIASTSFFDEGIAKLPPNGITPKQIQQYVSILNLHRRDRELLNAMCKKRGWDITK